MRELQIKVKWQKPQPNLKINDIVIVKEPSLTPGDWKLGKVIKTYADPLGVIRKVDLKTPNKNCVLHAVNQLIPLLKEEENIENPCNKSSTPIEISDNANPMPSQTSFPRRSPRNKAITMLQLCLIVLSIIPSNTAYSVFIKNLNSGVHIEPMGSVSLKAFDIPFSIKTNLNLTHDIEKIQTSSQELKQQCDELTEQTKTLTELCQTLILSIARIETSTIEEMNNSYRIRAKRWF